MDDEDKRPDAYADGRAIKDGDLVWVTSRGFDFVCFIDDSVEGSLRPATPSSAVWEQWLDAPDWETMTLIQPNTAK
ncbi:hypothetical protein K5D42_25045 [Pseudomonas cichorii]|nr:hypothetical protein [Pseudomonas cichorii]MBX8493140.1 hypothetical protein [Pseudomonas cichorii]